MNAGLKRKLAGAAAGVAIAAGAAGVADAVSGGSGSRPADGRDAVLNDVAQRLHVSPQKLKDAFAAALAARRPPYGAPGPPGAPPGPGGPGGPPPFGHPPHGPIGGELDAAAKYLGLTDMQLFARLRSGKSLAQVAADQNKSVDGLKNALDAEFKKRLDQIVNAKPGLRPRLGMRFRFRRHP
jgi:lambda repressor-like predicted transcriptional regulator